MNVRIEPWEPRCEGTEYKLSVSQTVVGREVMGSPEQLDTVLPLWFYERCLAEADGVGAQQLFAALCVLGSWHDGRAVKMGQVDLFHEQKGRGIITPIWLLTDEAERVREFGRDVGLSQWSAALRTAMMLGAGCEWIWSGRIDPPEGWKPSWERFERAMVLTGICPAWLWRSAGRPFWREYLFDEPDGYLAYVERYLDIAPGCLALRPTTHAISRVVTQLRTGFKREQASRRKDLALRKAKKAALRTQEAA